MPSINSNTGALFSVDAARKTDRDMSTAMKRLSTGDRITNAGDDAAGAAISDRMLSQVKGLEMSVRNAGDVISMAQVSEGALGEISDILQRVRELAIQSASDTYNATERNYIQAETNQLLSEFDRVTKDTEFNEVNVLDGSFASKTFQIGVRKGENASISVSSMRIDAIGSYQQTTDMSTTDTDIATSAKLVTSAANTGSDVSHVEADTLTINGQFGNKALSITAGMSAKQVVDLVNQSYDDHGVDAVASTQLKLEAVSSVNTPATTGVVTVAFDLYGKNTTAVNISAAITLGSTKATSDVETLRDAVNAYTAQTGIEAVLSQDKSNLILTNAEGHDIKIVDVNFDLETVDDTNLSTTTDADSTDTTTLNVTSTTGVEVGDFVVITSDHAPVPAGAYVTAISAGASVTLSEAISGTVPSGATVKFVNTSRALAVTGLGEDQTTAGMGVTLIDKDQTTHTFDSARVTGQVTFASTAQFTVQADTDKGLFSTSPGSATLKKLSTVKLNTRTNAVNALDILDKALDRINLERAKLGAIMSRMTKAIDNLSNVAMNTTESRGRITDADFALESANLTRAQILQQSATAMIAQASKSMQTVLDLLR
jgi:flagellin